MHQLSLLAIGVTELWEVQMNNKQKRTYEILNELKESIINSSLMLSDAHRDGRIN